jgi:hypothetical protein
MGSAKTTLSAIMIRINIGKLNGGKYRLTMLRNSVTVDHPFLWRLLIDIISKYSAKSYNIVYESYEIRNIVVSIYIYI